jgi:dual 3',5'-cyclic-AMP and -GMP phosphodiesterase 11
LLKPIVNTIDGTPTFLSITSQNDSSAGSLPNQNGTSSSINRTQRLSRSELKQLDEMELIFELVSEKWLQLVA